MSLVVGTCEDRAVVDPVTDDGVVGLCRWHVDDAAWYVESSRDPQIQRFTTELASLSAADVAVAIQRSARSDDQDAFLICSADGQQRLGNLGVEYHDKTADVSYWIADSARGHGAAARALTLLIAYLRSGGRVSWAELWTHADNIGSRRAAERAGFERRPDGDCDRTINGAVWPTVAYRRSI
jgi:RimJ/RimL family protein N-acetyltransferase